MNNNIILILELNSSLIKCNHESALKFAIQASLTEIPPQSTSHSK